MGALATLAPWIPEDDLLLKNAVEAGASLESLAKGAVQFSRKYSIREIQDRWYSLLYDPVISAEASAGMTNFELSASPLPSKFYRFGHSKEQKVVSAKRKSGSVRNLYYARCKRIRNSMLTSMDLSFLVDPGNGNYAEHESHPLSGTCVPEGGTLNLPVQYDFPPENVMDDNVVSDGVTANVFFPGVERAVEENFPAKLNNVLKEEPHFIGDNVPLDEAVEELDVPGELTIDGWIGDDNLERIPLPTLDDINNGPGNMCPDFDEKSVFDSTELECGTSFNLASLPEIPVWSTDEGMKESDMPCDGFNDSIACGGAYLEELSNSLLNFSSEEELFLMDVDGEEGIDKSYLDGLSSLLLNSTNDVNPSQVPKKDEAELQVPKTDGTESLMASQAHVLNHSVGTESLMASQAHVLNHSVSCYKELEDNPGSTSSGVQVVHKSEFQMSSPPLAEDPLFHELTNEVPSCSLNTEEQEIPDNEDVFLPFDVPPVIFPPSSKLIFKASKKPISSSVQDYGFNRHRANERGKSLMHPEKKIRVESQSSSQMMGSPCFLVPDGGSKVKCELPANHASHIVSTSSVTVSGGLGGNGAANTTNAPLHANKKEEATNADLAKDQCNHMANPFIKKSAGSSNDLRNNPQFHGSSMKNEQDLGLSLQDHQLKCAEVGSSDVDSELVADPLTLDEEEHDIDSDDELPSYSDVEAMVLDMDLDPDDHQDSCYSEEVSRYQHVESKRAVMRLEQGAHSCIQRAINAHGAFAILYGRHSKHYIKKPEVLLGRATEGFPVDIDLSKGGYSNSISRRQAIIKMDKEGSFYIKNFGKSSILVNSKEVHTGQSQRLHTNYLIEVRGIPLIFEINQNRVKRYLDHISDNSQTF